jgi:pyruvate/2-oxoglutarate dehydrogenase complex dihydrolipoamide dehydrogenase (E3) component
VLGRSGTAFHRLVVEQNQINDQILGATVAASHGGEMISEISLAMSAGIGLRALARVNHPYPTQAQAIKMAADAYLDTRLRPMRKWLHKQWLAW